MPWTSEGLHVTSSAFQVAMSIEEYYIKFLDYFNGLVSSKMVIDGYTIEYLLREATETIFGITDLTDSKNPLAIIGYTNADTLGDIGSVANLIQKYRTGQILDKFGLSIKEYMEMPIDVAELLLSNSKTEKEDIDNIVSAAERQANLDKKNKRR